MSLPKLDSVVDKIASVAGKDTPAKEAAAPPPPAPTPYTPLAEAFFKAANGHGYLTAFGVCLYAPVARMPSWPYVTTYSCRGESLLDEVLSQKCCLILFAHSRDRSKRTPVHTITSSAYGSKISVAPHCNVLRMWSSCH